MIYIRRGIADGGASLNKHFALVLTIAAALAVTACTGNDPDTADAMANAPLVTAATLGEQIVRTPAEYLSIPPYAAADRARGENHARVCRACHSLQQGGQNMIGPALYGFFGSPAGSRAGYEYSSVFSDADFVWTPRALDAWLAQPGRFLPGNRMSFAGLMQQSQRDDLIAYLLYVTTADSGD